jgi:hypothetical protein
VFTIDVVPKDFKCATRSWKKFPTKPVQLNFGKSLTVKIPTMLEDDETGVSFSDKCPVNCEVTVESNKAPKNLWSLNGGSLTFKPTSPKHLGTFKFTIKRKGGLHVPTEDTLTVKIVCKGCC